MVISAWKFTVLQTNPNQARRGRHNSKTLQRKRPDRKTPRNVAITNNWQTEAGRRRRTAERFENKVSLYKYTNSETAGRFQLGLQQAPVVDPDTLYDRRYQTSDRETSTPKS